MKPQQTKTNCITIRTTNEINTNASETKTNTYTCKRNGTTYRTTYEDNHMKIWIKRQANNTTHGHIDK